MLAGVARTATVIAQFQIRDDRLMHLCFNLVSPPASMRLRPKRTCSGVKCFGGFHIKRLFYFSMFTRGGLT
ncbi:hypothetical protein SAY86_002025 [Trapa natans]|uniref:Uncharacterized protein n=1 Tax=Trapa natans TaxID=22666 RepID=A0AAN7LFB6_TRANT|nr:hypothetical protein SAY86_002025 [Trapa natans]